MKRINIPDLLPNTDYALRVRVKNGDALSDWSPIVNFTTLTDAVPPAVPTGTTWVVNGDSFHGEWNAVTTNTDGDIIPITRYEIEVVGNSITKIVSVAPVIDNKNVFDLPFDQNTSLFGGVASTVTFRVRSVDNKELKSAWTTVISRTNPAPTNPTSFTATGGIGQIALSWVPPATSTDTDIVGYNLYIGATKIWNGNATAFVYPTSTFTSQTFTLKAVDKFLQESTGTSQSATANSPFVIDNVAPAVPNGGTAPTVTITTDPDFALTTYMDVSWTAVADPDGDVQGYKVRYRKGTSGNYDYVDVPFGTNTVRIRGLEPYQAYDVSVQAYDFQANYSSFTSTASVAGNTNTSPSQPTAPSVAFNTLQIQVTPTGNKQAGGAMEADVAFYEVYVSTNNALATSSMTKVGTIPVGPAMATVFSVPAQASSGSSETWYAKVVAVDKGNLKSSDSPVSSGSAIPLIANVNIADATITDAKITTLAVDKLTAGTIGSIAITARATLQIGDAANNGVIQSYEYVNTSGVSGWQFSKNGLVIKTGSIYAPSLLIQNSPNIVPPLYASFETPTWTANDNYANTGGAITVSSDTSFKYGLRSIKAVWGSLGSNPILWFGTSSTDYNIPFDSGSTYIVSAYTWTSGAVATNVQLKVKFSNGTVSTIASGTNASGGSSSTANRLEGTVTAPVSNGIVYIESSTLTSAGGYNIDGLQVELKEAGLSTASSWKPPGVTRIDGGMINTGSIQSTSLTGLGGTPLWSIPLNGSATFQNLLVRGASVIGASGDTTSSYIQSFNYSPGTTGWKIDAAGNAEFRQATITGTVNATGGTFSGTITGGSFVGSNFSTAAPGSERLLWDSTSGLNRIVAYTADSQEVAPGIIQIDSFASEVKDGKTWHSSYLTVQAPTMGSGGSGILSGATYISRYSTTGPSYGGEAYIYSGDKVFIGQEWNSFTVTPTVNIGVGGDYLFQSAPSIINIGKGGLGTYGSLITLNATGIGGLFNVMGHMTVSGTGWLAWGTTGSVAYGTNWAAFAGTTETPQFKRVGTMVRIRGIVQRTAGTATIIGNVPAGARPVKAMNRIVAINSTWGILTIAGASDPSPGDITYTASGTAYANGQYISFDMQWDTDQV